jgi:hypothetical protein
MDDVTTPADTTGSPTSSSWGSRGLALAALLAVAGTGFVVGQGTDVEPVTLSTSGRDADASIQPVPKRASTSDIETLASALPEPSVDPQAAVVVDLEAATVAGVPSMGSVSVTSAGPSRASTVGSAGSSPERRQTSQPVVAAPAPARATASATPSPPPAKRVVPGENDPPPPARPVITPPRIYSPYAGQIVEAGRVTVSGSGLSYGGDLLWQIVQNGTRTTGGIVTAGVYQAKYWEFTVDLVPGDAILTMRAPVSLDGYVNSPETQVTVVDFTVG